MDITIMRSVANISGSGSLEVLASGFWGSADVIEDDFGYFHAASGSLLLPTGWHDIGLSAVSQDGDFVTTTTFEIRLGRFALGTPQWSQLQERDTAGVSAPKRTLRGAVKFPSQDDLAIGVLLTGGTARDIVFEVQIFN